MLGCFIRFPTISLLCAQEQLLALYTYSSSFWYHLALQTQRRRCLLMIISTSRHEGTVLYTTTGVFGNFLDLCMGTGSHDIRMQGSMIANMGWTGLVSGR